MFQEPALLRRLAARLSLPGKLAGMLVTWLVPLLVLVIAWDVGARYLFNQGSVMLQELEWHLFAAIFLLGSAWTLHQDEHVRVDMVYRSERLGERHRALINLLGCLLFLLPFCLLIVVHSWDFVAVAWRIEEGSPDPGGLPARWIIKAVLPVGFVLLLLEGLAMALRNLAFLLETR